MGNSDGQTDRQTDRKEYGLTGLLACLLACLLLACAVLGWFQSRLSFPFYCTLLFCFFSQTSCLLACLLAAVLCCATRKNTHTHTHTLHYKNIQQLLHLPFFFFF